MKGKRYTTEDKIRILRAADSGQAILDVCREHNISEVSFHRWKRQFGQMEINEARRLKELERENSELKKMLAESLLKNRVLEFVCKKNSKPGTAPRSGAARSRGPAMFRAVGVSDSSLSSIHLLVSWATVVVPPSATAAAFAGVVGTASPVWVSADYRLTSPGGLGGGQAANPAITAGRRAAGAANEAQGRAAGSLDGLAGEGGPSWACLDVGLHCGCDCAWGCVTDAHNLGRIPARVPCAPSGSSLESHRCPRMVSEGD